MILAGSAAIYGLRGKENIIALLLFYYYYYYYIIIIINIL